MPPATAIKVELYKYTLGLVNALYRNATFRESFKKAIISGKKNYLGIPLGNHIWVLSKIDYNYRGLLQQYKDFLRGDLEPEKFADSFFDSFKQFYENRLARENLEQEVAKYEAGEVEHPGFVTPDEHQELVATQSLPSEGARNVALENFTGARMPQVHAPIIPHVPVQGTVHLPGEVTSANTSEVGFDSSEVKAGTGAEPVVYRAGQTEAPSTVIPNTPPVIPSGSEVFDSEGRAQSAQTRRESVKRIATDSSSPRNDSGKAPLTQRIGANLRNLQVPRVPQGLTLPIGKFIRRNVTPTRLVSVFTGGLGVFLGATTTGTALGAVTLGGVGAMTPTFIKKGGSQLLLSGGGAVANTGANVLTGLSSGGRNLGAGASRVGGGFTGKKVALLLLLFIFGASLFSLFGFGPQPQTGQNNVTIKKSGPVEVSFEKGDVISYTITVTYTDSGRANIEVTDQLDLTKVDFISASDGGKLSGDIVRWNLSGISANQPKNINLVVKPRTDNIWVVNMAEARVTSTAGGGTTVAGGSCPTKEAVSANRNAPAENCQYFNLGVNIFDTNISPEQINTYVNTYLPISRSVFGQNYNETEFRSRIASIVSISQRVGLNPVIFLSYWRSESGFANHFGCGPQAGLTSLPFDDSVKCAVGLATPAYPRAFSVTARCAAPNINDVMREFGIPFQDSGGRLVEDPRKSACREVYTIRNSPNRDGIHLYTNKEIHDAANYPNDYSAEFPIQTFDDFVESYGTRSPKLVSASNPVNGNCKNTYNTLVDTVSTLNACKASAPGPGISNLAMCSFTKGDQTPPSVPYQSNKLLSYFAEAQQKTGFPAVILASVARVESTTDTYSISNYTDIEIGAIENYDFSSIPLTADNSVSEIARIKDLKVPGSTTNAMCPVSSNNALGLMQIQPPGTIGHDSQALNNGIVIAKNAGVLAPERNINNLTLNDYCNPRTSIYLAAGFILQKLTYTTVGNRISYGKGQAWDPQWTSDRTVINEVARRYYGGLIYGDRDQFNYGDDIWNSLNQCKI